MVVEFEFLVHGEMMKLEGLQRLNKIVPNSFFCAQSFLDFHLFHSFVDLVSVGSPHFPVSVESTLVESFVWMMFSCDFDICTTAHECTQVSSIRNIWIFDNLRFCDSSIYEIAKILLHHPLLMFVCFKDFHSM